MRSPLLTLHLLACLVPALLLLGACKRTKYICPAYQSAFVLDAPAYKRSSAQDSMAASADTSLDADVIMVLAERILKDPVSKYEFDADSVPKFPDNGVVKTNVLLIKRISRRRKDKLMASVPMITTFPEKTDSAQNGELIEGDSKAVPAGDDENPTTAPDEKPAAEPAPKPAPKKEAPPAKKKEEPVKKEEKPAEDSAPF